MPWNRFRKGALPEGDWRLNDGNDMVMKGVWSESLRWCRDVAGVTAPSNCGSRGRAQESSNRSGAKVEEEEEEATSVRKKHKASENQEDENKRS